MPSVTARWHSVCADVAAECAKWGRDVNDVTLVVVTKFHPVSVIEELLDAGARHFGESRHQDAAPKADALADRDLTWHFVGQIQSNKARAIARYATVIHSWSTPSSHQNIASMALSS